MATIIPYELLPDEIKTKFDVKFGMGTGKEMWEFFREQMSPFIKEHVIQLNEPLHVSFSLEVAKETSSQQLFTDCLFQLTGMFLKRRGKQQSDLSTYEVMKSMRFVADMVEVSNRVWEVTK